MNALNKVKSIRESRLMSKSELARKAGVSTLTMDRIERGEKCRMETMRKIILALGLQLEEKDKVFQDQDITGLRYVFFKKKKEVVGIDIGSSSVKLVQLKDHKGSFQMLNAGIIPLPPEAIVDNTLMDSSSIAAAIKNLVASLGIKVKDVACSISGNSVIIRKIVLPAMPQEELEDQISLGGGAVHSL